MPKKSTDKQEPQIDTFDAYLSEVRRLLLGKDLQPEWVNELVEGDMPYLTRAYEEKMPPINAAFEVYVTEEELSREPEIGDHRLKLDLTEKANGYLQKLVEIGLYGNSTEDVATALIHQQLAIKLEAGLFGRK